MKTGMNKQFMTVQGKPVLAHTLELFERCNLIAHVILVSAPGEESCYGRLVDKFGLGKVAAIVPGGRERQESVAHGLARLPGACEIVAVHDGARPLLLPSDLVKVVEALGQHDGAILAVPVKDTVKEITADGLVGKTLDRSKLWAIQTPQVFKREVISAAYHWAEQEGFVGTDDASLVERYGFKVKIVEGSYDNIKITTPEDLDLAEIILRRRG